LNTDPISKKTVIIRTSLEMYKTSGITIVVQKTGAIVQCALLLKPRVERTQKPKSPGLRELKNQRNHGLNIQG
jgi:hypothetical protein